MRKKSIWIILLLIASIIPMKMQGQSYDKLWKQVEEAKNKSLPQTTVKLTEDIFRKAQAEKNSPQMLKAYTARSVYQQQITPDSFYVDLKGLEQWAKTAENQVDCAILHTVIAGIYADYGVNNQWALRQRAELTGEAPDDVREWSANLFVARVLDHTYAALEDSTLLLATSSKDYRPFVELGNSSEYYRHDLYHLLALKGIESLKNIRMLEKEGEVTNAISVILGRLVQTYKEKGNRDAFILASLDSLKWVNERNPSNSMPQLDELIAVNSNRAVCAEVYLEKANALMRNNEYVKALQIVDEAIAKYPKYERINAVRSVRESILLPDLSAIMASIIYPGADFNLTVTHRNLSGFKVEYHRLNLPVTSNLLSLQNMNVNKDFYKQYTRKESEQRIELVRPDDYLRKDTTITLKAPAEGLYIMRIVPDGNTQDKGDRIFSVTRLKVLSRKLPNNNFETVVLDGMTGRPVENAVVRLFSDVKGERVEVETLTTGADGKATSPWKESYRYLTAEKDTDKYLSMQSVRRGYYIYDDQSNKLTTQVRLLTDRVLYRPGQTVYVKGVAYNLQSDTANVISGKTYALVLKDANNREIATREVRTNDFGSFITDFVLPAAGLNGTYSLSTENGSTTVRVEEYKRPTFDITFEPQTGTYRIGDAVEVKGTVKSYSGVVVQGVPVSYTITRSQRSWWRAYWAPDAIIASGTANVDDNGNFVLPVTLLADEKMKEDVGYYVYKVEATVTNVAGETQSSQTSLAAGSRSILLDVQVPDRANKDEAIRATFTATNLNGQPVNLEGEFKVYAFTDIKKGVTSTQPVVSGMFTANKETTLEQLSGLPSGGYKLVVSAKDEQGREATSESRIILFSLADTRPAVDTVMWYYPVNTKFDKAHPAKFVFGSSKEDVYVLMDVFSGNKQVESKVLSLSNSLMKFEYPYLPEYGDGLSINLCFVKENEVYTQNIRLEKRIPEKTLTMKWEVFRDKLRPGQQEEWRLSIKDPAGKPAEAEMLATLYDASLDKIWKADQRLSPYYSLNLPNTNWINYSGGGNYYYFGFPVKNWKYQSLQFDTFTPFASWDGGIRNQNIRIRGASTLSRASGENMMAYATADLEEEMIYEIVTPKARLQAEPSAGMMEADNEEAMLEPEDIRTNFAETAFFYPQLRTNAEGEIVFSFTMPESLTRWNFRGYAHTKGMLTGLLNGEITTSKEFMLTPNLPRFVRVGDETSVAAAVTNTTGTQVAGTVTFTLFDPMTEKVISTQKKKFTAEAGKSTGVNFTFTATDKYDLLGCRIIADGGTFSDGEQHLLPVLPNKERITETVAMPIRGKETKEFSLESLFNGNSKTATDRRLTVEFAANPAWYAIQALPSVAQPTNDNAAAWASAYYANSLAAFIMNAQPRIKTMMDNWRMTGGTSETFLSNLQKNQDVKAILLEESPWLMEATSETEQKQRIATLFDLNNIGNNQIATLTKLGELQLSTGAWTWCKGMPGSRYMTMYVLTTLIRLETLTAKGLPEDAAAMKKLAFDYLHREVLDEYKQIRAAAKRGEMLTGISTFGLDYLYLVALSGTEIPKAYKEAYDHLMGRALETVSGSMKTKAMKAIVVHKAGYNMRATQLMMSLKEHLVQTDELGMHFAFNESPYRWNDLRIPAHVAVMEAFNVVAKDEKTVEEMKIWLLKQKQTQQWDSPVATVNAVYALVYYGSNLFENQGNVRIDLGKNRIEIPGDGNAEAGTGYVKQTFTDRSVVTNPRTIKVEKKDEGIAWGAVYAQYNEEIDKVNKYGNELKVDKKLYVERMEGTRRQLIPVEPGTQLTIGDKVTSRITITVDRAMDFVQLKDQRGACFEPIGALSGYNWNNGLGYYVAVKDASTNFFFDSLSKGVYVLEYSYRVSRAGTYQAGLAILQSAYAPEFAAHSASMKVVVGE